MHIWVDVYGGGKEKGRWREKNKNQVEQEQDPYSLMMIMFQGDKILSAGIPPDT